MKSVAFHNRQTKLFFKLKNISCHTLMETGKVDNWLLYPGCGMVYTSAQQQNGTNHEETCNELGCLITLSQLQFCKQKQHS